MPLASEYKLEQVESSRWEARCGSALGGVTFAFECLGTCVAGDIGTPEETVVDSGGQRDSEAGMIEAGMTKRVY